MARSLIVEFPDFVRARGQARSQFLEALEVVAHDSGISIEELFRDHQFRLFNSDGEFGTYGTCLYDTVKSAGLDVPWRQTHSILVSLRLWESTLDGRAILIHEILRALQPDLSDEDLAKIHEEICAAQEIDRQDPTR